MNIGAARCDTLNSPVHFIVTMDELDEEDREEILNACVHRFSLNSYSVTDGKIDMLPSSNVVADRKPETRAYNSESIYREYLGNNQCKVAYLVDESIANDPLVLWSYTGKIYVKIQ